jgi:chromosome segregation and condensation protein ScpB
MTIIEAAEMYAAKSISLSQLAEAVENFCKQNSCKQYEIHLMRLALDYAHRYADLIMPHYSHDVIYTLAKRSKQRLESFADNSSWVVDNCSFY